MEQVQVPTRLPCLLLPNQVLLPTGFCKLSLNGEGTTKRTAALLEYLGSGDKDVWVAILPDTGSTEALQDEEAAGVRSVPHDRVGSIATAARVLQLSRLVQSGDWVVLLEGVCRVRLDAVIPAEDADLVDYDCVDVTQLELCPPGAPAPRHTSHQPSSSVHHSHPVGHNSTSSSTHSTDLGSASSLGNGWSHSDASSASLQELGKQLKATTRALLRQLARSMGGAQPSRRVLELLNTVPAWRAADVVVAALSSNYQERLAVLCAVDHKQRVRLALQVAQAALDALQASTGSSSGGLASTLGSQMGGKGARSGKGTSLAALAGGAKGSMAAGDDEDPDGLDALMSRLAAAKPPAEVAKAAAKEYKRLRQSGENQPGYAAARAYLETLADLPWSRTAADLAAEERTAAATSSSGSSHVGTQTATGTGHHGPGMRSSPGMYGHTVAHGSSFGRSSNNQLGSSTGEHATSSRTGNGPPAAGEQQPQGGGTAGEGVGAGHQGGHQAQGHHTQHMPAGVPLSLRAARELLDKQHYGLDKIKDRVVEYLAVLRLKGIHTRAPILCFIGPPGVGKTSLARSVAEVLGRPFVRIALGGVRDEAEVRGHRRTYVGAMPGRVVGGLRRARCCDPVMLLDELDKLGKDSVRGDPSAALLEVLDPEQNAAFVDAYLGLPVDLSRVTFVATANRAQDIPTPLLDRLEVVSLSGYTLEEKVHIGRVHLVPKALADHGLGAGHVHFPDSVLEFIAERYTREAGVRNLTRNLAAICRHVAVSIVSEHEAAATSSNSLQASGSLSAAAAAAAAQHQVMMASAIGRWSSASGSANQLQLAVSSSSSSQTPTSGGPDTSVSCLISGPGIGDSHGAAAACDHGMASQQHTSESTIPAAADVLSQHSSSLLAATQLSTAFMDSMSLAGLSEAPLDRFWAVAERSSQQGSISSSHGRSAPAAADAKASSSRGFMSKVRLGSSTKHAHHHPPQSAQLLPSSATSSMLQPPHAWYASNMSGSPPNGSSRSWRLSWGSNSHSSSSGPKPAAINTSSSGSGAGWFGRGSGSQHNSQAPAAVSPAQVQYHGMPQALPYPPDLLQQHGAVTVTCELVEAVLGPPRFDGPGEGLEAVALPGAAAGLVWTSVGGSVQYIECARISYGAPGRSGTLTLTGQVGEVLEESARIALSWIRAHALELGLAGSPTTASITAAQQLLDVSTSNALNEVAVDDDTPDGLAAASLQARRRGARSQRGPVRGTDGDAGFSMMMAPYQRKRPRAAMVSNTSNQQQQQHHCATDAEGEDTPTMQGTSTRVVTAPIPAGAAASLASSSFASSPALMWDLHVHLPAGAIPKDGPSAGITLAVALVSLLSGRAVRSDTAMTGELTLRGLVLPVGGIKEKLLAARHAGLRRVLIPARNMRDVVAEVPQAVRTSLTIIPVDRLDQVLAAAFDPPYVLHPPPSIQARL